MNLKSISKTTHELVCNSDDIGTDNDPFTKRWVPLEIAQRELDRTKVAYLVKKAQRDELFAKIEAYRKWLSEQEICRDLKRTTVIDKITEIFGEQTPVSSQSANNGANK